MCKASERNSEDRKEMKNTITRFSYKPPMRCPARGPQIAQVAFAQTPNDNISAEQVMQHRILLPRFR